MTQVIRTVFAFSSTSSNLVLVSRLSCGILFKLRQGASIGGFCWLDCWSDGWLVCCWKKVWENVETDCGNVQNEDDRTGAYCATVLVF